MHRAENVIAIHRAEVTVHFRTMRCRNRKKKADLRRIASRLLVEAAGIEPSAEIAASVDLPCGCELCVRARAANALHSSGTQSHNASSSDSTLHWVVRHWSELPEVIAESLQHLSTDKSSSHLGNCDKLPRTDLTSVERLARNLARQCRSYIQASLREEEWLDADEVFFFVIRDGLKSALLSKVVANAAPPTLEARS